MIIYMKIEEENLLYNFEIFFVFKLGQIKKLRLKEKRPLLIIFIRV